MWNIKFYVFVYFYKSVTIDCYFVFKAHKPMSSPNSAFSLSLVSLSCTRTALAIGIIMAVVAVLLIHMERNHVGSIMPNINLKRKIDYFCMDGSMWDRLIYWLHNILSLPILDIFTRMEIRVADTGWHYVYLGLCFTLKAWYDVAHTYYNKRPWISQSSPKVF